MQYSCCLLLFLFLAEIQAQADSSIERRPIERDHINPTRSNPQEGSYRRTDEENVRSSRDSDASRSLYSSDDGSRLNLRAESSRTQDQYNPNPRLEKQNNQRDYNYNPAPRDDQTDYRPVTKERDPQRDYNPNPLPRDETSRRDYDSPTSRDGNQRDSKPVLREESTQRDHNPKPVLREENTQRDSNPTLEIRERTNQRDYNPNPVSREESNQRDYKERNNQRDYNPNPLPREESRERNYSPNPVPSDENDRRIYNRNPLPREQDDRRDYIPNPAPRQRDDRRDYNPNPVPRDKNDKRDYNPNPVPRDQNDKRDYNQNPVPRDQNDKRDYNPNPVPEKQNKKEDYNPNPVSEKERPIGRENFKPDLGGFIEKSDDLGGFNKDPPDPPAPKDDKCICVPYYQCQDGHIVKDGAGIIDARRKPFPEEELPLDEKLKPPYCGPFHVCCQLPEVSTVRPYEHRCGSRNPSGINSRILSPGNKGEADFGEWPWQAAVLKVEGKVYIFQCGGVLIDERHILTVGHCVFPYKSYENYPLKVRLGEWDTQVTTEFLAHDDYNVIQISIHHEFKNSSLWNDIAVLKLDRDVVYAPHVDSICLPEPTETFAGQNCIVTGWGKDAYKGGTFSNIMKEVAIMVIDSYTCEELLRKTRLGRFFQLYDGFMCAGGEQGLDSCKGDGGGPLACYTKSGSYVLAGLVSWGIDCGHPGVPGVYVKVQKYLDWISKVTGKPVNFYWPNA